MRFRRWSLVGILSIASGAVIADIGVIRNTSGTFIRFDGAKSEHLAVFCGADGYEEASVEYGQFVVRSLEDANFMGIEAADALAALERFHCAPSSWPDMTATEKSQFCGDSEISGPYAIRLNKALGEAKARGMATREAMAVIRSVHCDTSL
jgi:hypothetical protein